MIKLLILADDFTGALDSGIQFSISGAKVRVINETNNADFLDSADVDVLVVNTDTRHVSSYVAHNKIFGILSSLKEKGLNPLIYKKTDSALRGNIGVELDAVLENDMYFALFFVPAYPKLKRVTKKGVQYVDGVPVHMSDFAKDSLNPVEYSFIPDIIGRNTIFPIVVVSEDSNLASLDTSRKAIYVFDATTNARLKEIVSWLPNIKQTYAVAGCAGFANYLSSLFDFNRKNELALRTSGKIICAMGSLHVKSFAQAKNARAYGFKTIQLCDSKGFLKNNAFSFTKEEALDLLSKMGDKAILMPRSNINVSDIKTGTNFSDLGDDLQWCDQADIVSSNFGKVIAALYDVGFDGILVVSGGDTLSGILSALGCQEVEPIAQIEEGVVLSQFNSDKGTHYVVSKSGGMGSVDVYERIHLFMNNQIRGKRNGE